MLFVLVMFDISTFGTVCDVNALRTECMSYIYCMPACGYTQELANCLTSRDSYTVGSTDLTCFKSLLHVDTIVLCVRYGMLSLK